MKFFFHVFPIKAYVKYLTRGRGHFWPKGDNLNKFGRGPLGDAKYQILKALGLVVSDKKICSHFPYISQLEHVTPRAGHFLPKGYHLNKLSSGLLGDATYRLSIVQGFWFQTRIFFHF